MLYPYHEGWRCKRCAPPKYPSPGAIARFQHVKFCGDPAVGGIHVKKGFSARGTSYNEDHYGVMMGMEGSTKNIVQKIVPATSFSGSVWKRLLTDKNLAKFSRLLWPRELCEPRNLLEGAEVWYTLGAFFRKATFLDIRQSIDADQDVVIIVVDGELETLQQCMLVCKGVEKVLATFTQQMMTKCAPRTPPEQLKRGGIEQGADIFLRDAENGDRLIEEIQQLEEADTEGLTYDEAAEATNEVGYGQHVDSPEDATDYHADGRDEGVQVSSRIVGKEAEYEKSEINFYEKEDAIDFECDGRLQDTAIKDSTTTAPSLSGGTAVASGSLSIEESTPDQPQDSKTSFEALETDQAGSSGDPKYQIPGPGNPLLTTDTRQLLNDFNLNSDIVDVKSGAELANPFKPAGQQRGAGQALPTIAEEDDARAELNGMLGLSRDSKEDIENMIVTMVKTLPTVCRTRAG